MHHEPFQCPLCLLHVECYLEAFSLGIYILNTSSLASGSMVRAAMVSWYRACILHAESVTWLHGLPSITGSLGHAQLVMSLAGRAPQPDCSCTQPRIQHSLEEGGGGGGGASRMKCRPHPPSRVTRTRQTRIYRLRVVILKSPEYSVVRTNVNEAVEHDRAGVE